MASSDDVTTPQPAEADGTPADKKTLRGRIRADRKARRRALREAGVPRTLEAERIARAAIDHFDSCPQARAAGWGTDSATVAAFRSTPSEPDTSALLDALLERGVRVLVPRTQADMSLDWHQLLPPDQRPERDASEAAAPGGPDSGAELPSTDDAGDEGPALGHDAVAGITAMILPGLAVDRDGHRLGQGGGCYDRTLPRLTGDTCRAVLVFDSEILPSVPFDDHDQLIPALLTPEDGWQDLRG